jgi:hypothetical protein
LTLPRTDLNHAMMDVAYLAHGLTYHCLNLAKAYAVIALSQREHVKRWPELGVEDRGILGHQLEPYFEFDSVLALVRRLYDSLRYLLWPRYGNRGSMPASLYRLLAQRTTMPEPLKTALLRSWEHCGDRVTAYRDCTQHYVPVDFHQCAFLQRHSSGAWTASMRIPDNPDSKSKKGFTFAGGLDALTFAWEATHEAISAASLVVAATTTLIDAQT